MKTMLACLCFAAVATVAAFCALPDTTGLEARLDALQGQIRANQAHITKLIVMEMGTRRVLNPRLPEEIQNAE